MYIHCSSDHHFEFQHISGDNIGTYICNSIPKEKADICILAGDIGMIKNHTRINVNPLLNFLEQFCEHFKHVIIVHGNHEYYKNSITQGQKDFKKKVLLKLPNLHWLNNDIIEIEGQRFLGCTLWAKIPEIKADTPYGFYEQREKYYRQMNCFDQVYDLKQLMESEHDRSVKFITDHLKKDDVLITHFPAVTFLQDPWFKDGPTSWYYTNKLDELILEREPKLVVCGHDHSSVDRTIGNTRFIRNPYGYFQHSENKEFKQDLLIEI